MQRHDCEDDLHVQSMYCYDSVTDKHVQAMQCHDGVTDLQVQPMQCHDSVADLHVSRSSISTVHFNISTDLSTFTVAVAV